MKVYVVSRMCDDEYFCTEVVFVTADEKYAKECIQIIKEYKEEKF